MFTVVRLADDQTLENITAQGAPSGTWPRDELVADVLHKALYAFPRGPSPTRSPATRRPGGRRVADVPYDP